MQKINKTLLMILDGWGIGNGSDSDVIAKVGTPFINSLKDKYPNSKLLTSGENVGLPDGQMGNSEVGHLNIGAGRVIYQDLVKINHACIDDSIAEIRFLKDAIKYAKNNDKAIHLLGLVSDGGVHSSIEHLNKLCDIFNKNNVNKVFIHCLMDGRDTDPRSGIGFIKDLQEYIKDKTAKISTICGRYYTMDRDKRWERVKKGYDLMIKGAGERFTDPVIAVQASYDKNITDEFIEPILITDSKDEPIGLVKEGDVMICFNFRTDRLREITTALTQKNLPEYEMHTIPLYYLTMTNYDDSFRGVKVLFDKENLVDTIGEIVSNNGLNQLRIAETEKYAHVTFFFSGGREEVFPNEDRILVNSPKVATYDLQPEMSAYLVKDKLVEAIKTQKYDFITLNFANGDMVGHTGVYSAIEKAVKVIDECVKETVSAARTMGYEVMIIADHGNADYALNPDGTPNTAHSLNPVPCILVSNRYKKINDGILADVAPTLLTIMGLEIPKEMTGKVLI